jgi:hypothetical protein
MTAHDERLIGRWVHGLGLTGLAMLVGVVIWAVRVGDMAATASVDAAVAKGRVAVQERRTDSLIIELRHLPDAVADTLRARSRRPR